MISLASGATVLVEVEQLDASPLNPRQDVDTDLSAGLASVGQLEPILVRPHPTAADRFEIANGHRRWAGAKKAGIKVLEARIRDLTDSQMLDIMLGTGREGNVKPLTPMDEAIGYAAAIKVMALSQREVAKHFGISPTEVNQRVALLDLPAAAKKAVANRLLPPQTAWLIARIPTASKREEVAPQIMHSAAHEGVMPYAAAKIFIEHHVCRKLQGAPFDVKDATLVPAAGACVHCPFNSANNRETYDDTPKNTCMSPVCFEEKVATARAKLIEREEKNGKKAISAAVNAKIFPKGESGMTWDSDYVELAKTPTADLLKKEVATALQPGSAEARMMRVPTWRELCSGAGASVQIWVGFNQQNHAVDLVKLSEALLAADENERAIFNAETIKAYNLDKGAAALKQERGRKLGKPADTEVTPPAEEDDAEAGDQPGGDPDEQPNPEAFSPKIAPDELTRRLGEWIASALDAAPTLPPRMRETGFQLLRESGVSTEIHHTRQSIEDAAGEAKGGKVVRPGGSKAQYRPTFVAAVDGDTLTEWQKARDLGMSPQKIAAAYRATLEDVCGALAIDEHAARNEVSQLRQAAEDAFASLGIMTASVRDRTTAFATRGAKFEELTQPEQFRALLRVLSQRSPGAAAPQAESSV